MYILDDQVCTWRIKGNVWNDAALIGGKLAQSIVEAHIRTLCTANVHTIYSLIYDTSFDEGGSRGGERKGRVFVYEGVPLTSNVAEHPRLVRRTIDPSSTPTEQRCCRCNQEFLLPQSAAVASTKRLQRDNEVALNGADKSVPGRNFNFDR